MIFDDLGKNYDHDDSEKSDDPENSDNYRENRNATALH